MDYLYDGSFEGLLTCIYYNYYRETANGVYPSDIYQPSLMHEYCIVSANSEYAGRVYQAIEEKLSRNALFNIYYVFLAAHPDKENLILRYLRLGFRIGSALDSYHTHPVVQPLHKTARKVAAEVHRFLGLLRFADHGRFLYARLSPDHNILPLLADHFAERLKNESWVIEDEKRRLAVIYDGRNREKGIQQRQWYVVELPSDPGCTVQASDPYEELWKLYFNRISIESRRNPRLQNQFVPLRYRKNLIEFK